MFGALRSPSWHFDGFQLTIPVDILTPAFGSAVPPSRQPIRLSTGTCRAEVTDVVILALSTNIGDGSQRAKEQMARPKSIYSKSFMIYLTKRQASLSLANNALCDRWLRSSQHSPYSNHGFIFVVFRIMDPTMDNCGTWSQIHDWVHDWKTLIYTHRHIQDAWTTICIRYSEANLVCRAVVHPFLIT